MFAFKIYLRIQLVAKPQGVVKHLHCKITLDIWKLCLDCTLPAPEWVLHWQAAELSIWPQNGIWQDHLFKQQSVDIGDIKLKQSKYIFVKTFLVIYSSGQNEFLTTSLVVFITSAAFPYGDDNDSDENDNDEDKTWSTSHFPYSASLMINDHWSLIIDNNNASMTMTMMRTTTAKRLKPDQLPTFHTLHPCSPPCSTPPTSPFPLVLLPEHNIDDPSDDNDEPKVLWHFLKKRLSPSLLRSQGPLSSPLRTFQWVPLEMFPLCLQCERIRRPKPTMIFV